MITMSRELGMYLATPFALIAHTCPCSQVQNRIPENPVSRRTAAIYGLVSGGNIRPFRACWAKARVSVTAHERGAESAALPRDFPGLWQIKSHPSAPPAPTASP